MQRRRESQITRGKLALFSAFAIVGGLLVLEGSARLFVPPPEPATYREHKQLIEVLGLPALNGIMEFDPVLFWRLRPELRSHRVAGRIRAHEIDFSVTTHAGLRSDPVPETKRRFRVLALGDSCTFGVGVNDDETWPAQLQRMLREEGIEAEVLNAGVPGYSAFQGMRFLASRGLALSPDLVLVTFGFNDFDDGMRLSDLETAAALERTPLESALDRSRLAVGMRRVAERFVSRDRPTRRRPRLTEDEFIATLDEIRGLCLEAGIHLLVVVWPHEAQVREQVPDLVRYQVTAARFCIEREVDGVNLVSAFLREQGPLFVDHIHANAAGCRAAARALLPFVQERALARLRERTGALSGPDERAATPPATFGP